jgi:hypothetical protein
VCKRPLNFPGDLLLTRGLGEEARVSAWNIVYADSLGPPLPTARNILGKPQPVLAAEKLDLPGIEGTLLIATYRLPRNQPKVVKVSLFVAHDWQVPTSEKRRNPACETMQKSTGNPSWPVDPVTAIHCGIELRQQRHLPALGL